MMNKNELLVYEAPSISEWISIDWIQTILVKYMTWKVNRKYKRYIYRKQRELFFKNKLPITPKGNE